jgi:N-glycosylase/DNA lyase
LNTIITKDFNLTYTIESGEFFRWYKKDGEYIVITTDKIITLRQINDILYFKGCDEKFIKEFFRLDFDIDAISAFDKFSILKRVRNEFKGLRLIKEDVWECTLSFVLSINSSIKAIQKSLDFIAKEYGEEKNGYYLLPLPHNLINTTFSSKIFGLRAKFLNRLPTAFLKAQSALKEASSYLQKKQILMDIYGIGDKVSECILLYSLNHDNAFPVDRWIKRFLTKYFNLKVSSQAKIRQWAQEKFGEYCGWIQQYIYMFARKYKVF